MIIVSQDRDKIMNFDNVTTIELSTDYETEKKIIICINTLGGEHFNIGKYGTEERAKEVLCEIYSRYSVKEMYKRADSKTQEEMIQICVEKGISPFIFEMPEK